ncbi:MAG: 7-carboxy-7-deazaguanine synthase [Candidatus Neomarinimicrobiota bacterium]
MSYAINEVFYSLQGEGYHSGRAAVFCRFSGCNLWSGHETDRAGAICKFCDTDFVGTQGKGGGKFKTALELSNHVLSFWPSDLSEKPFIVCTGGEPLLQLDRELIDAFHNSGMEIALETNGTIIPPAGIDWICVSPKANSALLVNSGDEIKIIYPQNGIDPADYLKLDFSHFFLQPMDSPILKLNTIETVNYCKTNQDWKLSLQIHKYLGIS